MKTNINTFNILMRNIIFLFSVAFLILNLSCNDSSNNDSGSKKNLAASDSLMNDIMADHGTAMAKMNKVSLVQGQIRHVIDSIRKLTGPEQKKSAPLLHNLDSMLTRLQLIETRMNQWMDEFNMDSLENNPSEQKKYLESERQKTSGIKDDIISVLQNADSLLIKVVKQ